MKVEAETKLKRWRAKKLGLEFFPSFSSTNLFRGAIPCAIPMFGMHLNILHNKLKTAQESTSSLNPGAQWGKIKFLKTLRALSLKIY